MEVCAPFHDTGSKKQESRPLRRLNFSYRTIKSPVLLDFLVGQHCINIDVCFWRRRRDLNPRYAFTYYSLSRGAPSASWVLLHAEKKIFAWRRERDSNPRCLSTSLVFKTSSINHSDISPRFAPREV